MVHTKPSPTHSPLPPLPAPQGLISRFASDGPLWSWAVGCVAELDALMSLAAHALGSETPMCRPQLLRYCDDGGEAVQRPLLEAVGLVHPSGVRGERVGRG